MTPSARDTITDCFDYANTVVQVKLASYFYRVWVVCCLVPVNKVDPDDLPLGTTPDYQPVKVGNAEHRHITRGHFDEKIQSTYNKILGPVQNGVGISGGISITAFGLQSAIDASPGFTSIKDDLDNGYTAVKRDGVMVEMKDTGKLDHTVVFM